MIQVNITKLRNNLPAYMGKVKAGEEVAVTSRGKIIARLIPEKDESHAARLRLDAARKDCRIGDVLSPIGDLWDAGHDSP